MGSGSKSAISCLSSSPRPTWTLRLASRRSSIRRRSSIPTRSCRRAPAASISAGRSPTAPGCEAMALNPVLRALARRASDTVEGAPPGALLVAPQAIADLVEVVAKADADRTSLLIWGGGSHQGLGNRVDAELVLATSRLNALVDWQPDDLTVVVGAGMRVADLDNRLAERGQTPLLPAQPAPAPRRGGF